MDIGLTASFFGFLAMFVAIGVYSATRKKATPDDYLLASRSVSPWLMALSAVATQNSGYMFVGLTGVAYAAGVSAAWLQLGWIVGDYIAWRVVHRRLRETSSTVNTVPDYLGRGMRGGAVVVVAAAIITLVFLGIYAAAQLTAGSKALGQFGLSKDVSIILGAAIVVAYCFAGGIRASIWTDAAQSIVMIVSMTLLLVVGLTQIGGLGAMWSQLEAIDPALTDWGLTGLKFGLAGYLLGWIFAGFGVIGQPHIMVRAMTLDDPAHIDKARRVYMAWFIGFSVVCVLVGLMARVLLGGELLGGDVEMAFPMVGDLVLPKVLFGLALAGLFAATISTADSQILSCSAALSQDLFPRMGRTYVGVKAGTLVIAALALGIALADIDSVFGLVILAWSGLASTLGPLMVVRALRLPVTGPIALAMMAAGLGAVLVWVYALQWGGAMYEALPGMLAGGLTYLVLAAPLIRRNRREQEALPQAKAR